MPRSDRSRRPLTVARLRHLGHLTYSGLVRASLACFSALAAAFAALPLAPETLARVGLLVVGLGWLALLAIYLAVDRTVVVRPRGAWYVAEDARAGIARHGRSVDEAVANLARMLEPGTGTPEPHPGRRSPASTIASSGWSSIRRGNSTRPRRRADS